MILGIDLAARYSAAAVVDAGGKVTYQFDSWGVSAFGFCEHVALMAKSERIEKVVVEDLPYGINSQFQVKAPLRLQGVLARALGLSLDKSVFVMPSTWQQPMGVWKVGPENTALMARQRGYEPPDTVALYGDALRNAKGRLLAAERKKLEKVQTDYVDAFLIAEWARIRLSFGPLEGPGIQNFSI